MKIKPVILPADGMPHKCIVEWWYYNGLLEAEDGRRFAYMMCLFKVDNKKVSVPVLRRLPFKTVFFTHSLLSDITNQKFDSSIDYFSVMSKDSFSRELFYANFTNPLAGFGKYVNSAIEESIGPVFHLKRENFDLQLVSKKPVLLEDGTGYVKLHERDTYYYSYTNLKTEGVVLLGDKEIKVKGKSWMDHQWADNKWGQDHWTWFSIQLDNDIELVCCEYKNGDKKDYLGSIIYADGHSEHAKDVILTPLDKGWISNKTKAKYNLVWKIEIPSKKISLQVAPEIKNQEMVFGTINYWEGPMKFEGVVDGVQVQGRGFLELVGQPIQYGAMQLTTQILKNIKDKMSL